MGLRQTRHSGGLPGFSLGNNSYPDLGLDIAILTNLDGIDPYLSIARPMLAAILERPEIALSQWSPESTNLGRRDEALLRNWLEEAETRDFDALRPSASFARFLDSPRRARIARIFQRLDLKNAKLLGCTRQEPVTSFQFKTDVDGQDAVAHLTLTDGGETRFLDVRAWGARQLSR